jgi:hypothetical protein
MAPKMKLLWGSSHPYMKRVRVVILFEGRKRGEMMMVFRVVQKKKKVNVREGWWVWCGTEEGERTAACVCAVSEKRKREASTSKRGEKVGFSMKS